MFATPSSRLRAAHRDRPALRPWRPGDQTGGWQPCPICVSPKKAKDGVWGLTTRGRTVPFSVLPAVGTRGRKPSRTVVPGSSAARLLALLETPRHRADLAGLLGVTRERVRQSVVSQRVAGRIRGPGSGDPIFALALASDPVVLLTYAQERVLSAFAEEKPTTLSRLAVVAHRSPAVMAQIADSLRDAGLIEQGARRRMASFGA
jgi:hypothetical protein